MKFRRKSGVESKISTSSMPDIIFMLLIFFMVTTVLREFSGLPVSLPRAERIEKLESKRHTSDIWVSKDGLISIEDKLYNNEDVRHVMYEKRASNPQLTVSLKADESAKMEIISEDIESQIEQVFKNLGQVLEASGSSYQNILKLNVYLTDLTHFGLVNKHMEEIFEKPFPARAAIGINQLPKDALIEIDAIATTK